MILKGKKNDYQLVVGLEIHAQVNSDKKLFSNSSNNFGTKENHNVNIFDIAIPGTLPVLNEEVIEPAIRLGFAINAKINRISRFDRKNYFYPDQPSGYQITQFFEPILTDGFLDIDIEDYQGRANQGKGVVAELTDFIPYVKRIRINRMHLEQDAGKLIHSGDRSLIDFNRAGVPLMEIVTEPDFRTINEVLSYLTELRRLLRFIKICQADLEKGTFRCDVNISLMNLATNQFGTRCEIKNLNSFKSIERAIIFEADRHFEILERGEKVHQETRLFDADLNITEKLRDKEDAEDYRYFPDPDLPPIFLSDLQVEKVRNLMPKLPKEKEIDYKNLGLAQKERIFLCSDPVYADFFDKVLDKFGVKLAVSWVLSELLGRLKSLNIEFENSPVSADAICELLDMISSEKINGKIAKDVLDKMLETKKSAKVLVEEIGLSQVTDRDEILKIVQKVCEHNQKQVQEYKDGSTKMLQFLIGMCMKESGGKVNPKILNECLIDVLNN